MTGPLVLTYHAVALDVVEPGLQVTPETLRRQIGWLRDAGFTFVSAFDLCEAAFRGSEEKVVALTFDDGYDDFAELAWPCLQAMGVPGATVFLCPDHAGQSNHWNTRTRMRLRHMDLETLRRLRDAGVHLEPHGREHRNFFQLAPDRLEADLDDCSEWFRRHLAITPRLLAYPYGDVRDDQLGIVGSRFAYAFATHRGRGFRDRLAISRRGVGQDTPRTALLAPLV